MVAIGATEGLAAAKFLIELPAFFARLGCVCLLHLNDLARRKENHFGFQSFSKSIVRPATHSPDHLGLQFPVAMLHHPRYLEPRNEHDSVIIVEEDSYLVVTVLNPNPNPYPISLEGGKKGSDPKTKRSSAPELVPTREIVINPFWNNATKAWSQRLLYCAKANCDELPSASWTPTLSKLALNSWFKAHAQNIAYSGSSPMVSSPSQPELSEVMINTTSAVVEKEKPSDGKLIPRARGIRIFPTPDQKETFSCSLAQYIFCTIKLLKKVGNPIWNPLNLR